jgi:hypothetical protein
MQVQEVKLFDGLLNFVCWEVQREGFLGKRRVRRDSALKEEKGCGVQSGILRYSVLYKNGIGSREGRAYSARFGLPPPIDKEEEGVEERPNHKGSMQLQIGGEVQ